MTKQSKITYFVHDLADPAVCKRVQMLQVADCHIKILGFSRSDKLIKTVAGNNVICLGKTEDAKLIARGFAVLKAIFKIASWAKTTRNTDALIARTLEMLVLAWIAKITFARKAKFTYELLDIHRTMLGTGVANWGMRKLESFLLRKVDSIIISSPAFEEHYLKKYHKAYPKTILIENKVFNSEEKIFKNSPRKEGFKVRGWRIGWFGVIRCRESLLTLLKITKENPGLIEVDIRGRIAYTAIPDFDELVSQSDVINYMGPYKYPEDLESIYNEVDFVWAIDFYEKGLNSTWLLPNRIYEGCLYGAVPIAVKGVETGLWLIKNDIGITIDEPLSSKIPEILNKLSQKQYVTLSDKIVNTDKSVFMFVSDECVSIKNQILSH